MPLAEKTLTFGAAPRRVKLSVLTPFHKHDPSALLAHLSGSDVEVILLDDGSSDAGLLARVVEAAEACACPVKVIVRAANAGRSVARNRLVAEANGEYVLFLDADMIPDTPDFLARWLDLIQRKRPFVAFGGLSLRHAEAQPETALHHFLFARSDCRSAWVRERTPAQSVASSNLLVRRDLLNATPFDDSFSGWGWEDVEWALRVSQHAPIQHVDIPATHAGLDSVETLLRKGAEAGPNYGRMARRHPQAMARLASHRIARALKLLPGRATLKRFCAWLARDPFGATPMAFRSFALKTFRAAHYAEHLP